MCSINQSRIKSVLDRLASDDNFAESEYASNKAIIRKVWSCTESNDKHDIKARLTLIDSMYSTQMNRRYYALDELAETMWILSEGDKSKLSEMFLRFVDTKDISIFDYYNKEGKKRNLWRDTYGISKDGKPCGVATSLISKYAYFETEFRFPIYDSIVREMIPYIWPQDKEFPLPKKKQSTADGGDPIRAFITIISEIRSYYNTTFDLLDRLLWFVGKIRRGNLSLILSANEYQCYLSEEDSSSLKYIENELIRDFFELAKKLQPNPAVPKRFL